jgi:hypothetical protein
MSLIIYLPISQVSDIAEALVVFDRILSTWFRMVWCKNGNFSNFNSCKPNNISKSLLSLSYTLHQTQFLKQEPFVVAEGGLRLV